MSNKEKHVLDELKAFKRKFFIHRLVRGLLISLAVLLTAFLVMAVLEFSFRFGSWVRGFLLLSLLGLFIYNFYRFLLQPVLYFAGYSEGMTDADAARMIGSSFPQVKDRLLNLLQLRSLTDGSVLAKASIRQKLNQITSVSFRSAIKWSENRRYLKYVFTPVGILLVILFTEPAIITDSSSRILQFNREFVPEAPFTFEAEVPEIAFRNEDLQLSLELTGEAIPGDVYVLHSGRKLKMQRNEQGRFSYTFSKVQDSKSITFLAAGFYSREYKVNVVDRPALSEFSVSLRYPAYIGKRDERHSNTGNLSIPEGTEVEWLLATSKAREVGVSFFSDSSRITAESTQEDQFTFDKKFFDNDSYTIHLKNEYSKNKENITYYVRVIKDEYPEIFLNAYQDTVMYNLIALGGNISDDYGLRSLSLNYTMTDEAGNKSPLHRINIPITPGQPSQGFFYEWVLDSIDIRGGEEIAYYLEVWDNDGVNGSKPGRTGVYLFKVPDKEQIREEIRQGNSETEESIEEAIREAEFLEEKVSETDRRLKGRKELEWEDEKMLEEILEQKENLQKAIDELMKRNMDNRLKKERFSPQSESLREKAQQVQESMDRIMDEETRKLYEELKRLMEEESGAQPIQEMMEQLSRTNRRMRNELERVQELVKRMQVEEQLSENVQQLNEMAEKQEELGKETKQESRSDEEIRRDQEELNRQFEKMREQMEDLRDENQELERPVFMPDQTEQEKRIQQNQEDIVENLKKLNEEQAGNNGTADNDQQGGEEQNREEQGTGEEESESWQEENSGGEQQEQNGKQQQSSQDGGEQRERGNEPLRQNTGDTQEKTGRQMKQMSEEMKQVQASMQMEAMQENIDDLRNIVHNLLKLSFDQENLFKEFRDVNESDPRFISLSQEQLKLRDDAQVLEDSLLSLAKRVFQLSSFITREVSDMNMYMENSMEMLRERNKQRAISEQQFAMTSMNNLALLLDDVLDQMMNAMAESMGMQKQQGNKEGQSLGEQQKQLNQRIEDLKNSGKSGRELSEELAKLAAEQARIREALQEMQQRLEELNGTDDGRKPGGNAAEQMEETETDLVHKRLTEEMIRRQRQILTRLLEAEDALREREMDDERKGETARDYEKIVPRSFEEYLKQKQQEVEMLKTLPPKMYPYYKREVSEYFKRIGDQGVQQ